MPLSALRHKAGLIALTALFGLAQPGVAQDAPRAQEAGGNAAPEAKKFSLVKLTLHPAAVAAPALKYHLLPEVGDLKPGNAALLYQRAHSPEWWTIRGVNRDRLGDMLEMPLAKMPRDKSMLPWNALRELDLAARREYCDWELTPRIREEGYALLIPDIQEFRVFGHALAVRARFDMLDGKLDQAIADLQTGFALGRHVGEAPMLVSSLVGMAIGNMMVNQVEELVQLEKAPNLYWALADLPRPLIDMRRALQGEKLAPDSVARGIHAALKNPNQGPIPLMTINQYLDSLARLNNNAGTDYRLYVTIMAARTHPKAKAYLLENGFTAEQVTAMPVTQVALMYALALFQESYDEAYKWHTFPYWQARDGLAQARKKFEERLQLEPEAMFLARDLTPALDRVISSRARLERRLAMLQVVEALRLHAAAEGKLPGRLDDIRAVPVPIDPVTGKAFEYAVENGRAILFAPPPPGEAANERTAVRYEISLAVAKKS